MKIGIIGLGDMGLMFAAKLGAFDLYGYDLPERIQHLKKVKYGHINLTVDKSNLKHCELIFFAVETRKLPEVCREFSSHIGTKTIVCGQSASKEFEATVFDQHFANNPVILAHALHGPSVDPKGQYIVLVPHRDHLNALKKCQDIFQLFQYKIVTLPTATAHDELMAETQTLTHFSFLSMGATWARMGIYPWEDATYNLGLDNIKAMLALRLFSGRPHVYSEIAILNRHSLTQTTTYCESIRELLDDGKNASLRIQNLADVFLSKSDPPLFGEEIIRQFNLKAHFQHANSHLSLLAMLLTWKRLNLNPYKDVIAHTPPYKLRLGLVEMLLRDQELLTKCAQVLKNDAVVRKHDESFYQSTLQWAKIIESKDYQGFENLFLQTQQFFAGKLKEAKQVTDKLIEQLGN